MVCTHIGSGNSADISCFFVGDGLDFRKPAHGRHIRYHDYGHLVLLHSIADYWRYQRMEILVAAKIRGL